MSENTNTKLAEELDNEIKDVAKKLFQDGATLGELKGITPRELNAVYQMGLGFYNTGRYDDAEKVFSFLVMFDHLEPKYWLAAGAVQQVKKNFEKAKAAYVQAAMLDIHGPKPQYYVAECYLALGQKDDALASLETLLEYCNGQDEVTFAMPNDNVTLLPVFTEADGIAKLDFSSTVNGTVPEGWRCVQENNDVHEYPNSYSSGARTFVGFTGHQGKALYWREEYAEYGRQPACPLTLEPGSYKLTYSMAAWKGTPKYKVQILDAVTGSVIAASEVLTASPNANGNTSANLTSAKTLELPFTIEKAGKYVIRFSNESRSSSYDEYLLLECKVSADATGIATPFAYDTHHVQGAYTLNGHRVGNDAKGVLILRSDDGTTRKILKK